MIIGAILQAASFGYAQMLVGEYLTNRTTKRPLLSKP